MSRVEMTNSRTPSGSRIRALPRFMLEYFLYPSALLFLPLIWIQGIYLRRGTTKLPEARGERYGECANCHDPIRLTMIGESPVAGVGVSHQKEALPCQLATRLAEGLGRPVHWRSYAATGAKVCDLARIAADFKEPTDILVISFGVNDTIGLTSRRKWRQGLETCLKQVPHPPDRIYFCSIPALDLFPHLPEPVRTFLGIRSAILDRALYDFCRSHGCHYLATPLPTKSMYFAVDGFHPSKVGVSTWAASIASTVETNWTYS